MVEPPTARPAWQSGLSRWILHGCTGTAQATHRAYLSFHPLRAPFAPALEADFDSRRRAVASCKPHAAFARFFLDAARPHPFVRHHAIPGKAEPFRAGAPDPRIFAKPLLHETALGPRIQSVSPPRIKESTPRPAGVRTRPPGKNKAKNCKVRRSRNLGSASPPRRGSHQAPGENKQKNCKVRSSYKLGSAWPPQGMNAVTALHGHWLRCAPPLPPGLYPIEPQRVGGIEPSCGTKHTMAGPGRVSDLPGYTQASGASSP